MVCYLFSFLEKFFLWQFVFSIFQDNGCLFVFLRINFFNITQF